MSDEEHTKTIREALYKVAEAITAAKKDGLVVTCDGTYDIRNVAVISPQVKVARYY